MGTEIVKTQLAEEAIAALALNGDISKLSLPQKLDYYMRRCKLLDLDPATKPFDYLVLNGRQVLYPNAGCAAQLRFIHGISFSGLKEETTEGLVTATIQATDRTGRTDIDVGAVPLTTKSPADLANARMKAITKAKRRVTLSLCGLHAPDDDDVAAIGGVVRPAAVVHQQQQEQPAIGSNNAIAKTFNAALDRWLDLAPLGEGETRENRRDELVYMTLRRLIESGLVDSRDVTTGTSEEDNNARRRVLLDAMHRDLAAAVTAMDAAIDNVN
jgi:hypothetical protein